MAVSPTDLKYFHSGGTGNSDPNASLGGLKSTTEVADAVLQNLFANVPSAEAAAGSVKYRCIYIENTNGVDSLLGAVLYIHGLTASPDTEIDIGLDSNGKNATAATIANEDQAPAGVTFSRPTTPGAGLDLTGVDAGLQAGDFYAFWIRRTVDAGAASAALDNTILRTQGDTV